MNYNEFVDDIVPEENMEDLDGFIPNENMQLMDDLIDSESDTEINGERFSCFFSFFYATSFIPIKILNLLPIKLAKLSSF